MSQLGDVLIAQRARLHMSQTAFAKAVTETGLVSCSAGYINKLERGTASGNIGANMLTAFAQVIGWPIEQLISAAGLRPQDALDRLRAEGTIPPDVMEQLEQAAPDLSAREWAIIVTLARQLAEDEADREARRRKQPITPPQPRQEPEERSEPPSGPGRISARGRLRQARV